MTPIDSERTNLSRRQTQAIPYLVGAKSIEEGRKRAGIAKKTYFRWSQQPAFKTALEGAREAFVAEALNGLKSSVSMAIATLVNTMADGEPSLRVRAAGLILDHFWKAKELQELESRLKRIEEMLKADGGVQH